MGWQRQLFCIQNNILWVINSFCFLGDKLILYFLGGTIQTKHNPRWPEHESKKREKNTLVNRDCTFLLCTLQHHHFRTLGFVLRLVLKHSCKIISYKRFVLQQKQTLFGAGMRSGVHSSVVTLALAGKSFAISIQQLAHRIKVYRKDGIQIYAFCMRVKFNFAVKIVWSYCQKLYRR